MVSAKQIGNAGLYKDLRNQLAEYLRAEYNVEAVPFERVSVAFCNRLEVFLRTRSNSDVTLSNSIILPDAFLPLMIKGLFACSNFLLMAIVVSEEIDPKLRNYNINYLQDNSPEFC